VVIGEAHSYAACGGARLTRRPGAGLTGLLTNEHGSLAWRQPARPSSTQRSEPGVIKEKGFAERGATADHPLILAAGRRRVGAGAQHPCALDLNHFRATWWCSRSFLSWPCWKALGFDRRSLKAGLLSSEVLSAYAPVLGTPPPPAPPRPPPPLPPPPFPPPPLVDRLTWIALEGLPGPDLRLARVAAHPVHRRPVTDSDTAFSLWVGPEPIAPVRLGSSAGELDEYGSTALSRALPAGPLQMLASFCVRGKGGTPPV